VVLSLTLKQKPDGHTSPRKAFICFARNAQAAELLEDCAQRGGERGEAKLVSTMKNIQQQCINKGRIKTTPLTQYFIY